MTSPSLQGGNWQKAQLKAISKKLSSDPVYRALGVGLQEAMIAREVVTIMRSVSDLDGVPLKAIDSLFEAVCQSMLPDVWGK
ncbi:MAG TPA: hypothetical protein VFV58_39430 [Blastocatellia bacterium]|nr:hypothetical protein [Blastocatellia bacterium]